MRDGEDQLAARIGEREMWWHDERRRERDFAALTAISAALGTAALVASGLPFIRDSSQPPLPEPRPAADVNAWRTVGYQLVGENLEGLTPWTRLAPIVVLVTTVLSVSLLTRGRTALSAIVGANLVTLGVLALAAAYVNDVALVGTDRDGPVVSGPGSGLWVLALLSMAWTVVATTLLFRGRGKVKRP